MLKQLIWLLIFIISNPLLAAKEKKEKKFKPVAIPTISADRSKGVGAGVIAMGFFKISNDEKTPPSRVGLVGKLTTTDNYAVVAFQQLFLKHDKWRINSAQVLANSNFQTYVSSANFETGSMVIPYNSYFKLFFLTALRESIWDKFYIGPLVSMGTADTKFDLEKREDRVDQQTLNSVGLNLNYDTTKNKYNAENGMNVQLMWMDFPEWFDNASEFGSLNLQSNFYQRISHDKVMAYRATGYYAYGDVPFVGQRFVGNNDIRGYTTGQYRGDEIYATQAELRWNFHSRWGGVFFGGLAMAKDKGTWSDLLPGVGTGVRYQLLKEEGINAGLDYAVGNADWGIYFRMTEAF